jgi:RNA polymerase subunit RPABC4/transcription elongation factor Spt4
MKIEIFGYKKWMAAILFLMVSCIVAFAQPTISASRLYMEYESNGIKFEMDYAGKTFYITGKVSEVARGFLGDYVVRLEVPGEWVNVTIVYPTNIPSAVKEEISEIEQGEMITVLVKGRNTYSYVDAVIQKEESTVSSNQSNSSSGQYKSLQDRYPNVQWGTVFFVGIIAFVLLSWTFWNRDLDFDWIGTIFRRGNGGEAEFEKLIEESRIRKSLSDKRDSEANHKTSNTATLFCRKCGTGVNADTKFCTSCGARQEDSAGQKALIGEKSKEYCYDVLGIPRYSSVDVVKRAYRQLAVMYHPDKNPGNASALEKFREITDACKTLLNIKENFMPFCTNCGADITEELKFCMSCGKPINRNVAV